MLMGGYGGMGLFRFLFDPDAEEWGASTSSGEGWKSLLSETDFGKRTGECADRCTFCYQ